MAVWHWPFSEHELVARILFVCVAVVCLALGWLGLPRLLTWPQFIFPGARGPVGQEECSFPDHTFSASRLFVPGKIATVEYDSSSGSRMSKLAATRPTILQEFDHIGHSRSDDDECIEDSLSDDESSVQDTGVEAPLPAAIGNMRVASSSVNLPPTDNARHPTSRVASGSVATQGPTGLVGGAVGQSAEDASSAPRMHTRVSRRSGYRESRQSLTSIAPNPFSEEISQASLQERLSPSPSENPLDPTTINDNSRALSNPPPSVPDDSAHERVQSAQQSYIRRVVRNTAFFQTTKRTERLTAVPPELSLHPELLLGDLYFNRHEDECRLWLWEADGSQQPRWKPIGWGYERPSDHKVLILSEKKALPSWVQKSHFVKHTQNHPELQDMLVVE